MARLKGKKLWQTVGSVALAVITFVGVALGISALAKKADEDMKVINPKYEIGGLNENGKYEETNGSIYTKESFECQGLTVKPEFDSAVKYQIFFYNEMGEFMSATEVMQGAYNAPIPQFAIEARIEITPDWSFLGVTDKDEQIVKWYEVNKYAKQIEVSVLKEQSVTAYQRYALFSGLTDVDLTAVKDLSLQYAGFVYDDMTLFAGKTITRIGVPVGSIANPSNDCYMTVSVIKADYTVKEVITTETLTIKANTFSTARVNQYYYFDVNIEVGAGETLMFCSTTDSISPRYSPETVDTCGRLYWKVLTDDAVLFGSQGSLLFDIYVSEEVK